MATTKLVPVSQNGNQEDAEELRTQMLETMAEFSNRRFTTDNSIARHTEPAHKVSLPEGMPKEKGASILIESARADAEEQDFNRVFKYRPLDGAYNLHKFLLQTFGTGGRGRKTFSFFEGVKYPQTEPLEIGLNAKGEPITAKVPWGEFDFEFFEGHFVLESTDDPDYGPLFKLTVHAPKRLEDPIEGFFEMFQVYLAENTIYKGKAITGTDKPKFLQIHPNPTIVYNEDVQRKLKLKIWNVMSSTELMKSDGRKINNKVVLYGPYGTGKSECGQITAKIATEFGWTFIEYRIGENSSLDDLKRALSTARLLQPACVFIEDINLFAARENAEEQSRLQNMIDGVGSKNDDVMLVMTSNHAEEFSKAMLRARRIDALIEIGLLDREATERMIKFVVGEHRLDPDMNYDRVWEAVEGYEPAFINGIFDDACTAALQRTNSREYIITTEDLLAAAETRRPQWELFHGREDGSKEITIEGLIGKTVTNTLSEKVKIFYPGQAVPFEVKVLAD